MNEYQVGMLPPSSYPIDPKKSPSVGAGRRMHTSARSPLGRSRDTAASWLPPGAEPRPLRLTPPALPTPLPPDMRAPPASPRLLCTLSSSPNLRASEHHLRPSLAHRGLTSPSPAIAGEEPHDISKISFSLFLHFYIRSAC